MSIGSRCVMGDIRIGMDQPGAILAAIEALDEA